MEKDCGKDKDIECPFCGNNLTSGDRYCPECGTDLDEAGNEKDYNY